MNIGKRIQQLLNEKKLTQRQLAEALHLNPNTVNGYIHSRRYPDCETAAAIAAYLNISVDYLLGNSSIRHLSDLPLSKNELLLIDHYRSLDEKGRQLLEELSVRLHVII